MRNYTTSEIAQFNYSIDYDSALPSGYGHKKITVTVIAENEKKQDFTYFNYTNNTGVLESWIGIFTQNNCEATDNNQDEVINEAWNVFKNHLTQLNNYE